jgi:replicative DNA helicase
MQGGTAEQFQELMAKAEKFDVDSVRSIATLIQESIWNMYSGEEVIGLPFPWPRLTKLTNTLKAGDMFVIAAKPGVGKTTFALNMLYHYSHKGIPTLLFELEMRPERLMPRLVQIHLGKEDINNLECLSQAYNELKDTPLYMAYNYEKLNFATVSETIRMCVRRYGIQFVVFDNLHFLIRGTDQTAEVSRTIREFKILAEDIGIPICVIARPRKVGAGKRIDSEDLKDSADIEGDSDFIILLHRKKTKEGNDEVRSDEGIFEDECKVRVDKARWASGGDCILYYQDKIGRIVEDRE